MLVIEFVERMAFAVRNDLSVKTRAPDSKAAFCAGFVRVSGRTGTDRTSS